MSTRTTPIGIGDTRALSRAFSRNKLFARSSEAHVYSQQLDPDPKIRVDGFQFLFGPSYDRGPLKPPTSWRLDTIWMDTKPGPTLILWSDEDGTYGESEAHPTWAACRDAMARAVTQLDQGYRQLQAFDQRHRQCQRTSSAHRLDQYNPHL